ncbi:MAG: 50S ribosomal protein L1 [SAR202 cluster bacterium]|nr:50S ribosomal protein L1 [SAR202 cluster bacterium]
MATLTKRYKAAVEQREDKREYTPQEAVEIVKKMATAKFDETIELHIRTGADPRQADQLVRGVAVLPHGVGKVVRVLVFTDGEAISVAQKGGADFVGADDLIKKVEGGWTEFDVAIATPDMMGKIGRLGRVLGRKGLMPNPRTGTVVPPEAIDRAISDAKKGRVEYKLDRTGLMHLPIGKASFEANKLVDNLSMVMDAIVRSRPSGIKGQFIRSAFLTSTMGPSVKMDVNAVTNMRSE